MHHLVSQLNDSTRKKHISNDVTYEQYLYKNTPQFLEALVREEFECEKKNTVRRFFYEKLFILQDVL